MWRGSFGGQRVAPWGQGKGPWPQRWQVCGLSLQGVAGHRAGGAHVSMGVHTIGCVCAHSTVCAQVCPSVCERPVPLPRQTEQDTGLQMPGFPSRCPWVTLDEPSSRLPTLPVPQFPPGREAPYLWPGAVGCPEALAGCQGDAGVSPCPHCARPLLLLYLGQEEVWEVGGAAGATPCLPHMRTVAWPPSTQLPDLGGASFGERGQ